MYDLFGEAGMNEMKHVLQKYAASKKIIRLAINRETGSAILLRVKEVGENIFHTDIIDPTSRMPRGQAHLPISLASNVFCLDEDNLWHKLEQTLSCEFKV